MSTMITPDIYMRWGQDIFAGNRTGEEKKKGAMMREMRGAEPLSEPDIKIFLLSSHWLISGDV